MMYTKVYLATEYFNVKLQAGFRVYVYINAKVLFKLIKMNTYCINLEKVFLPV